MFDVFDRAVDERGLLKRLRIDRHVIRQRWFQCRQRRFDLVRYFEGVCIGLLLNRRNHIGMHVEAAVASLQRGTDPNVGYVLDQYRGGIPDSDDGVCEVFEGVDAPASSYEVLQIRPFQKST